MKKKVLALVVLAAMLISILPMAAFAAASTVESTLSKVYVDTEKADADGEETVEIDVMLMGYDNGSAALVKDTAADLYVYSSRGSADRFYLDGVTEGTVGAPDANGVTKITGLKTSDGWFTLEMVSTIAGTGKVYISTVGASELDAYISGDTTAIKAGVIPDASGNYASSFTFTPTDDYDISFTSHAASKLANGAQYYEVEVSVTSNGQPVSGKEVSFSVNKSGASLTANEATTNSKGVAKVKMTATKPNNYTVTAEVGDVEETEVYVFGAATINSVKRASDDNQKIALDESNVTLKYSFYDANGNKIKLYDGVGGNLGAYDTDDGFENGSHEGDAQDTAIEGVTLMAVAYPSGADINDELEAGTDFTYTVDDSNNLKVVIDKDVLDKEGDYEIKLALINGSSVTYSFNVKEQGDITAMTVEYDSTTLAADTTASTGAATVKLKDAEGYSKTVTLSASDKIKFTVDNASLVDLDDVTGEVTVATEDPAVVTVTAIDTDSKQVATATINIVKKPAALKITPAASNIVGEEASVDVQIVDVDGKAVAYGVGTLTSADAEVVILSKPTGAVVSADEVSVTADANESGEFSIDVISNTAGDVKIQVVLTVNDGTSNKVLTGSGIVTFGEASAIAGNNIIFIIGASSYVVDGKPVAATSVPFIENGRTYLGVRDMGLSMGIIGDENIVWNNATQTAKLVKDGITVEVTVGASAIKVTKNSVTTEVAIDAPAQNKDGRVFLPFRAVFEAFGYSVEYANGTITVTK